MMKAQNRKPNLTVISLGGSIVYPHKPQNENGINVPFLLEFRRFITELTKKNRRFIIVVGGGKASRMYQKAYRLIMGDKKKDVDLDWLGIQVTKMNALFLAKIMRDIAFPQVLDHEPGKKEVNAFLKSNKKMLTVSGWLPGWSTDYDTVRCAQIFGAEEIIIAGDAAYVCDKDPRKFPDAKPIMQLTWSEYQKLIPAVWVPGLSTPVDPPATKVAKKINLTVKLINGNDLENFRKAIEGEQFDGSTISGK